MPPAVFVTIASFYGIILVIQEGGSAGNMAPLGGLAFLFGVGAIAILIGALLLLLFLRPKRFPAFLTILALCNSIAIGFSSTRMNYQANIQEIVIHILDFDGFPIQGATLQYERFGYGPGGIDRPAGRASPLVSDAEGIVRPNLRSMRNKLQGTVKHPQYQEIMLELGMQFSEWDTTRNFKLGTPEDPDVAHGRVSVREPLTAYIYMPPRWEADGYNQKLSEKASTTLSAAGDTTSHLNLASGDFVSPPEGDLRFELYFENDGQYKQARLRIHALTGTGI